MQIAKDTVVMIEYTLTDVAGKVLDSSVGHDPLTYLHGAEGIIPGLESALTGKSAGDSLKVTIPPEQAYGPRIDAMVQDVPRAAFGNAYIEVGMQFRAEGKHADSRMVTVVGIQPDSVKVDANHPLAGQTLNFDVKVVSVRAATPEEIAHRHAHGPGGHHH